MWRQYAHLLSCEERIWTSSTRAGASPSRAAASKPIRALNAFGAAWAKLTRVLRIAGPSAGVVPLAELAEFPVFSAFPAPATFPVPASLICAVFVMS